MAFVERIGAGDYYVFVSRYRRKPLKKVRDWFYVIASGKNKQIISVDAHHISCPKALFGKKVRLKLDVVKNIVH